MRSIQAFFDIIKEILYVMSSKQKKYSIFVLIIVIISSCFELLGVTAILPFIQSVLNPQLLFENKYLQSVIIFLQITTEKELMIVCGTAIILLYIVKNLFMLFSYYIQQDFASRVRKELAVSMLKSYMERPYTYFLNVNSSEILRGCDIDVHSIYEVLSYFFVIVTELLTMTLVGGFLLLTDFYIALGIIVLMLFVMLGMVKWFKPVAKKAGEQYREAYAEKSKIIVQMITGVKDVYVMQRRTPFIKKYEEVSDIARKAQRADGFIRNSPERIVEGICVSGLIGIVCIRLCMNQDMQVFIPKLAVFAMAAFKILPSVGKITSRISGLVYYRHSLANVYNITKEAKAYKTRNIQYIKELGESPENAGIQFENSLNIQNVTWQYENQKRPVLMDIALKIQKGQSVALIGASGAGKTTLADIILGVLKPQKGMVFMDGIDVFAMPKTWARIVGYVPQSVFLIDDTVRNNIAFGLPQDEINDELIWDALERAQLKGFIKELPDGLDTIVGERGVKFSGGQRQRIAIARALYNKPEILVLDEATAALDNETETAVMESIEALQGQITMIIVAHRLTTIRNCDRIYEIKDGKAILRDKKEVLQ